MGPVIPSSLTVIACDKSYVDNLGQEESTRIQERMQNIADTMDAVLDEQINQWATGMYDSERLADMSRKSSVANQARALQVALKAHEAAYNDVAV
jgi:hypothetical protein